MILLKILAVVFLVFLNGFFVAAEFALVKVRRSQLDTLVARGSRLARVTRKVIDNLDTSLSACQLGITLASLALGWVGEPIFSALLAPVWRLAGLGGEAYARLHETAAVAVGFTVITFLHISAGEQAPKWFAIQRPLPTALAVSGPLLWFRRASYPFIWILNEASLRILDLLGIHPQESHEAVHSEEELKLLLAGFLGRKERESSLSKQIILNAFELRERVVKEAMQPRREIVGFDDDFSVEKCVEIAEKTRFSRFPILKDGDLDQTLGVIHIKDLYARRAQARTAADLLPWARPIVYIPEVSRLDRLLAILLERRLHFSIVVDEYGSTVGLITLEDILEELVGEIRDEFDTEETAPIEQAGPNEWVLDGAAALHELEELTGLEFEEEEVTTVSGLTVRRLGRFPEAGDLIPLGEGWELTVEKLEGQTASRLRLRRRAC